MFMGVCNNCWCRGVKGLVRLGMIIIYNAKYLTCNMVFRNAVYFCFFLCLYGFNWLCSFCYYCLCVL